MIKEKDSVSLPVIPTINATHRRNSKAPQFQKSFQAYNSNNRKSRGGYGNRSYRPWQSQNGNRSYRADLSCQFCEIAGHATSDFRKLARLLRENNITVMNSEQTNAQQFPVANATTVSSVVQQPRIQASGLEGPIPSSITLLRTLTDLRISERNAAKEKQLAIENISAILRNLTSKQTLRVSEVSRKIDEVSSQDNKMMLQDVSNMMQVSDDGKTEDNTKLAINRFNERNMVEIESFIRETIQVNNLRSEEIAAAYVSMDTKFQSDASDLKSCVNDSLMLDQEMKKEFDSMSKICVDHLTCLGHKHGDSLEKGYQVDQNCHPRKCGIDVPSLISIEAMRTPSFADLMHSSYQLRYLHLYRTTYADFLSLYMVRYLTN
ncbi:kinesin-like protein KIN-5B [Tanacetum coccineum]